MPPAQIAIECLAAAAQCLRRMQPEGLVQPGGMLKIRIARDGSRAQESGLVMPRSAARRGSPVSKYSGARTCLAQGMVGPRDRRAGDVGARLGEEFRQRTHAADRRLNTVGERLRVSQKQGQDGEDALRGVDSGISSMELRECVLHDLKFEVAVGDQAVVTPRGIKIRGRDLRQFLPKLAHLRELTRGGRGREIGQRVVVVVDTDERRVDRPRGVVVGEESLEPGVERVLIGCCACWLSDWRSSGEGKIRPAPLVVRDLDGVDDLLHPGAVVEVPLVARRVRRQLVEEVLDQIGVEEREPRLARAAAFGIEPIRHHEFLELDVIRRGGLDRFGNAELLDQPGDDGALRSVEADLDPRIVADGDEAASAPSRWRRWRTRR